MSIPYDAMAPIHDPRTRDRSLARLRQEDPIHWDAENDWWLVTRHADIRAISSQSALFSSRRRAG